MKNLSPLRRRAALLASAGTIFATAPVLIFSHMQGRGHDFISGICLGMAVTLIVASLVMIKRDRTSCGSDTV